MHPVRLQLAKGAAVLWNTTTGQALHTFEEGPLDGVTSVALSADGTRLVTGGSLAAIMWEAATGTKDRSFEGHTGIVTSVSLSANGQFLTTGSIDQTACLWETASGRKLQTFQGHIAGIASVALSNDGKHLVTGAFDGTAILWEAISGKKLQTLGVARIGNDRIEMVALSADGRFILTDAPAFGDQTAILWEAASGTALQTFPGDPVALSSDGKHVWTAHVNSARLWHAATGEERCQLHSVDGSKEWLVVTPEGFFDGSAGAWPFASYRIADGLKLIDDELTLRRFHRPGILAEIWKDEP